MKISTCYAGIKAATWVLPILSLLCCTSQVLVAPFPARPDTVVAGELRGPFDGQVVDQSTGNAISGALVVGTWSYERRDGLPVPAFTQTASMVTRSDGSYELPLLSLPAEPGTLLRGFTLIAYKAGYLGYRSDFRTDDRTPRHDFAQHNLKIRLDRFPEGESHARHLRFLGGDGALRRAAQAEVVLAALELSQTQKSGKEAEPAQKEAEVAPLPKAESLLTLSDLQEVTSGKQLFTVEPLPDNMGSQKEGTDYDGIHFKVPAKNESFDAGLRIWRSRDAEGAEALYGQLRTALGKTQDKDEVGDRSLRAVDAKRNIYGVATLVRNQHLMLQLSCGKNVCRTEDKAVLLLSRALGRISSPAEPVKTPPPSKLQAPRLNLGPH